MKQFTEEIATTSDPCFNNTNHLPRVIYAADEKTATIDLPSVANESTDCSAQLLLENDIHEHSQNSVKPVSNNMLPPKCLPVMNENPSRAYKKTKNSQVSFKNCLNHFNFKSKLHIKIFVYSIAMVKKRRNNHRQIRVIPTTRYM